MASSAGGPPQSPMAPRAKAIGTMRRRARVGSPSGVRRVGRGTQLAAEAEHPVTALRVVVAPLLGGQFARPDGPEAIAAEECPDALAHRAGKDVGQRAPLGLGERVRDQREADTLAEEARQRVEA